jgi:hypothetical protein
MGGRSLSPFRPITCPGFMGSTFPKISLGCYISPLLCRFELGSDMELVLYYWTWHPSPEIRPGWRRVALLATGSRVYSRDAVGDVSVAPIAAPVGRSEALPPNISFGGPPHRSSCPVQRPGIIRRCLLSTEGQIRKAAWRPRGFQNAHPGSDRLDTYDSVFIS